MDRQSYMVLYNHFIKIIRSSIQELVKTVCKDRYELMCAVDAYGKKHVPTHDAASSVCGRTIPSTSSKEALISIGQKIKFIDNLLQYLEDKYDNRIVMNK